MYEAMIRFKCLHEHSFQNNLNYIMPILHNETYEILCDDICHLFKSFSTKLSNCHVLTLVFHICKTVPYHIYHRSSNRDSVPYNSLHRFHCLVPRASKCPAWLILHWTATATLPLPAGHFRLTNSHLKQQETF